MSPIVGWKRISPRSEPPVPERWAWLKPRMRGSVGLVAGAVVPTHVARVWTELDKAERDKRRRDRYGQARPSQPSDEQNRREDLLQHECISRSHAEAQGPKLPELYRTEGVEDVCMFAIWPDLQVTPVPERPMLSQLFYRISGQGDISVACAIIHQPLAFPRNNAIHPETVFILTAFIRFSSGFMMQSSS